jgi:membrane fusion protein (multidrug efflux system)
MPSLKSAVFRNFLALLAVAGLVAACARQDAPPQGPGAVPVTVVTLTAQAVTLTRELPGRTSAFMVAEVRPQVSGIVKQRLFTEGGMVEAGQPLYQLDDAIYQADYASARAEVARAQAALDTARSHARRSAELVASNLVSQQENDKAVDALRQAEADFAAAEAALHKQAVILRYTRVNSPISGRIGKSSVTQGALVTANQEAPLAKVQQLDPMYVDVTQSSAELLELRRQLAASKVEDARDQPVTILLEDGTRYGHDGKLAFSEVTVDPTTGSYGIRVVVPNPEHLLLPGMYVRAVLGSAVREGALLAPQQAIVRNSKGDPTAMVVGMDDRIELRVVKVSRAIGDKWLVEDGLAAGERVVVEGFQKIRPGLAVQAMEAGAQPPAAPAPPRQ